MARIVLGYLAVWLLTAVGCTKANPAATCADGTCSDPAFPFCDVDGSVSGEPGACVAITCQAGANGGCQGSAVLVCNADGTSFDPMPCANGCDPNSGCNSCVPGTTQCSGSKLRTCGSDAVFADTETCESTCTQAPTPHCAYLSPKYVPDACDVPTPGTALTIAGNATVDSSVDNNCTGGVVVQAGGPDICVMHYDTVSVSSGATLTFIGTRAVALVADHEAKVSGTIEVGATAGASGPGGGTYESGGLTLVGGIHANAGSGDGGAGFRTGGGAGGNGTVDGGTGNGGSASPDPATLPAFFGGPFAGHGGGGGGALTIISCRSTLSVLGTLDSRGGGGVGGRVNTTTTQSPYAGSAGGAGGYVVLQGLAVTVTGQTFANGGGGGAGNDQGYTPVMFNGLDGTASDIVCARGGIAPPGAGAGGDGGCAMVSQPGDGHHPSDSTARPGGGGGSMGFFQSYTPAGVTPTLVPAHASPGFQPNLTVETR